MMPGLVDTHCHFDFAPFYGNEEGCLQTATRAGVEKIIIPSVDAENIERILVLTAKWPMLYGALGLHPTKIECHCPEQDLALLSQLLDKRPGKVVAIGEIGLDGPLEAPHFSRQLALLDEQLRLAQRYDFPVILHSRQTHDRLAHRLRRIRLPRCGVIHGFSGSLEQAQAFVTLGYKIGVGGTITYPRANKTRQTIARLPLTSLLLETDAPDMPLQGYQGEPNRPERVVGVFNTLCQLRPESEQQIRQTLRDNTRELFGI